MAFSLLIFAFILSTVLRPVFTAPAPQDSSSLGGNQNGCLSDAKDDPDCSLLKFACLGDSWSSGEAYSSQTLFDNNKDNCHRLTHAYCPLMNQTTGWTRGGHEMHFTGCSGAQLANINEGDHSQQQKTGQVDFMILTIGGNNLGFADIARACIYQPDFNHNYGDFKDKNSDCAMAIKKASDNIKDFEVFIVNTIQDAMKRQRPNPFDEFHLFLTGYVEFFNADAPDCEDWSFGAWPGWIPKAPQPKLTADLRKAINNLINDVNTLYSTVPSKVSWPFSHVHYVDINAGFKDHRFCEPGKSFTDNYYSSDVWLWNLSPDMPADWKDPNKEEATSAVQYWPGKANSTQAQDFLTIIQDTNEQIHIDPGYTTLSGGPSGGSDGGFPLGITTRMFHPKQGGHNSIKQALLDAIASARVPGTVFTATAAQNAADAAARAAELTALHLTPTSGFGTGVQTLGGS